MDIKYSRWRWVVFASVMFTYLLMASQRTAPGLITEQLMTDSQLTASTIGLLISIQFFIYTSLQIPMGMLADRYGPNFFLIIGAILTGIGTIIYSIGNHEMVLFIGRFLTGAGDATIWVYMVIILSIWFKEKEFVRLIGIVGMTGSLGFLLATLPFSTWIDLLGWRGAFFSAGVLICLCGILLYFVLVIKPKQLLLIEQIHPKKVNKREKVSALLRRILSHRQAWALFCWKSSILSTRIPFLHHWLWIWS